MSRTSDVLLKSFNSIKNNYDNYIVKPANALGLAGFVFSVDRDTTVNFSADITDHYVEDNTAVQDHIALKPTRLVLRGYVGELVFEDKENNNQLAEPLQKLTAVSAYAPALSEVANLAKRSVEANKLDLTKITGTASDLWNLTKSLNPSTSKKVQAYLYFKALFRKKILLGVQTPFEYMANMIIEKIDVIEPEDTETFADFSLTLKQIKFATTETAEFDLEGLQNRLQQQKAPTVTKGSSSGVTVEWKPSLFSRLFG